MAVTIQAGSIQSWAGYVGSSPLYHELTVDVAAGADRALYLIVTAPQTTINYDATWVDPPTCDGAAMTQVHKAATGSNTNTAVWRLLAPSTGAHVVRIAVTAWTGAQYKMTAFCLDNVDQTTPEGTPAVFDDSSAANPAAQTVACPANGALLWGIGAHGITGTLVHNSAGMVDFSAVSTFGSRDVLHGYKLDASNTGAAWTGGATQVTITTVPINPAAGGGGGGDPLLVPPIALTPLSVAAGRASNF